MNESNNMCNRLKPINPNKPIRALSLDGGGIYGLTTALLLKQLCEKDKDFLKEDQVYIFSGTSAGAVNALLLATEKSPREAILSGRLERFWKDQRVYASHINEGNFYNPMSWAREFYSNLGIGSWFASEPYRELLKETFGDKNLDDLPNKVMVTTFDLYGSTVNGHRQWKPKMYYNFPILESDNRKSIADIAYAAGTPPGARDIVDGKIDGGLYVPNPAVNTIAKILEQARHYLILNLYIDLIIFDITSRQFYDYVKNSGIRVLPYSDDIEEKLNKLLDKTCVKICLKHALQTIMLAEELRKLEHDPKCYLPLKELLADILTKEVYDYIESESLAHAIKNTHLLSIGVGDKKPAYWLKDFSLGSQQFNAGPTNPPNLNFWTPDTFLSLDAPSENSEYVCAQAIGDFYHRLNPPLFGAPDSLPTLPATFLSKNSFIKEAVISQIECKVESEVAQQAILSTLDYLKKWKNEGEQYSLEQIEEHINAAKKLLKELKNSENANELGVQIAQVKLFLAELELKKQQIERGEKCPLHARST